ncbi:MULTISPECIES: Gldg family protein [Butyricimonas]|uniref:Gldg family protein n=1 Tax=Butyricimonas TaxID=574697 RepID=UPI000377189C|nr:MULTISPECIES: Gldg family protein [Butyricimonas]
MKIIFKIAKTELRDLFYSPIAWLILIIFTFQTGMLFADSISHIVATQSKGYSGLYRTLGIYGGERGLFVAVQSYLYLYIPLLTMSLMSRELGSGSIKLLYSSPVTNVQIILGKYFAMLAYGLVLTGVLLVYSIYGMCTIENVDTPIILTGLLGCYLLLCAYVAVGLFVSSLTPYQIVAAVGTLAILAVFTYVKGMWQAVPFLREITYWFGMTGRSDNFMNGMICSEDVLYFVVVVLLFLLMTIIRLQSRRQKVPFLTLVGKYVGVWGVAVVLAFVSSRPVFKGYYDATYTKMNTLTPNSQEIIKQLKGGLTITTYVNILDVNNWVGFPENYNEDVRLFEQYTRFKPEIKMKYVLYYDTVKNDQLEQAYPGMTYEEKARKVIERQKLNPRKILTPEKIRKRIDLRTTEGNRTVRLLERESGEKTFLRLYNDASIHPTESEISAALKRLVMTDLPTIGFLTGHGERETDRPGDRNYCMFTHLPMLRQALVNQGFDYQDVTLDREIPEDISILVIAEMREPMTEAERVYFDKYVARGGNLVIIGEPGRQEVMNPILDPFGVKLVDGFLIQPEEESEPQELKADNMDLGPFAGFTAPKQPIDLIRTQPTKGAQKLSYYFSYMIPNYVAAMPTAAGLEYTTDKGFEVIPLFMSDSTCWNELEYTDIVDKDIVYNPAAGEVQKSYPLALALSRKVGDRDQKIVVLGDADCLSDGELTRSRQPLWTANYTIIQASFFWLSDYKVPIDIRRPSPIDRRVDVSTSGAEVLNYALIGGFPGLLFILYMFIWLRRRGR